MSTTTKPRDRRGRFAKTRTTAETTNGSKRPKKQSNSKGANVTNEGVKELSPKNGREMMSSLINNVFRLQRQFWERMLDPRRDIDDECGYPQTETIDVWLYRRLHDREPIANRVVNLMPDECWVEFPEIFEDGDPEVKTKFEEDFEELGKTLRGNSFYEDQMGHPLWEMAHRVDRLSGIGQFGVLLIGTDHDVDPSIGLATPIELGEGGAKTNEVLFIRAFDETLVEITDRDTDINSPRFGMPLFYNIAFESAIHAGITPDPSGRFVEKKRVHWTRVIHVAETTEASEVFAVPRIRPNLNRILDIRKLHGGSAEMYWRGALPPIVLETHPELGTDVDLGSDTEDQFEQMMNSLQRWVFLRGMTAKQLAPTVSDPSKQIEVQIDAICVQLGCPKRVFMGSERGELASSQDARTWNNRVRARQYRYLVPRLIVPLIDRLIQMGCLTKPEKYEVEFPDLNALTELEQAQVNQLRVDALTKYAQSGADSLISEVDFLEEYQSIDGDRAEEMLERAQERMEEKHDEEIELFKEQQKLFPDPIQQGQPGAPGSGKPGGSGKPSPPGQIPAKPKPKF